MVCSRSLSTDSLMVANYMRLEVVLEGEAYGLNGELMEVLNLLPPGLYTRDRLCGQINSSLSSHGWGYVYGAVH